MHIEMCCTLQFIPSFSSVLIFPSLKQSTLVLGEELLYVWKIEPLGNF